MFPEQKPKSSVLATSKLILAAVILISISMVLGVAGYLAMNKLIKNPEPQISITPEASPSPIVKDETADLSSKASATGDWKTYKNEDYGFEVKFPSDLVLQKNTGEAYISFEGKSAEKSYFLQFGYVSQSALNAMGISYCGEYLGNDSRCENFTFNNLQFLIDWSIEVEGAFTQSRAEILKPDSGMVVISILHSPDQDIKLFFRQILSTFKFTEKDFSFSCGSTIIADIDNNIYRTVQIGDQCWLKENLRVTKNPEGKAINRYCYDNDPNICETDGGLYDWNTAMNNSTTEGAQGICPSGWHIPKDSEWYTLENYLKDSGQACNSNRSSEWNCSASGTKLKKGGSSGFDGIFAGLRNTNGFFIDQSTDAFFWSSSKIGPDAWFHGFHSSYSGAYRNNSDRMVGFSIRCLKD